VPDYGRPESRPEELRPGMAVTIQPAGIRFNPPALITFPNADGMAVGNDLNLWSLSPDTGTFNIVGKSTVSSDGQSIITIEVGSLPALALSVGQQSGTTPNQGSNFCGSCRTAVGSEANVEEGSLYITHNVLHIARSAKIELYLSPTVHINTPDWIKFDHHRTLT